MECSSRQNPSASDSQTRRQGCIDLSPVARTHPLFPIMDYIARSIHSHGQRLVAIEAKLAKLDQETQAVRRVQEELHQLMVQVAKKNFNLKDEGFESPLRCGVASLFCDSLTREITDDSLIRLVKGVLKSAAQEKHKFDTAIRHVKRIASVFRTEERRRVLGVAPCQSLAILPTNSLTTALMAYMKAPDAKKRVYSRHLALLRKYTRNATSSQQRNFYGAFKSWLQVKYAPSGSPSEEEWRDIVAEDEQEQYSESGSLPVSDESLEQPAELDETIEEELITLPGVPLYNFDD